MLWGDFLRFLKRISCFFDKITHEIKLINLKNIIICSFGFLLLGILSWIIGGSTHRVIIIYDFPRSALKVGIMFILWGLSFLFCGAIFSGVLFGCEKFKRHKAYKIAFLIVLMHILALIVYPLFFGATAPFWTLLVLVTSILICFYTILNSYKIYSLWTILLSFHFFWLIYNAYICLAIIFIN